MGRGGGGGGGGGGRKGYFIEKPVFVFLCVILRVLRVLYVLLKKDKYSDLLLLLLLLLLLHLCLDLRIFFFFFV